MTEFLLLPLAFILPLSAGMGFICAIDSRSAFNTVERVSLGFVIGSGLLSLYMFAIGMAGIRYSFLSLAPYFICGALLLICFRHRIIPFKAPPAVPARKTAAAETIFYAVIISLLAWKLFFILYHTFATPTYFEDALSTWNYKAKAIYYGSGLRGNNDVAIFGGTGAGYPLSLPLFRAWIAIATGAWRDSFVNLHNTALLAFTALFFFSSLKRLTGPFTAALFTYIFASLPLIPYHAFGGYADLPMACLLFITASLLARWFLHPDMTAIYLAAPIAATLMFTKNEGVVVYAPLLITVFASYILLSRNYSRKIKLRLFGGLFALITVAALPWLAGKIISNSGLGFTLEFHADAFAELFSVLFKESSFHVLWLSMLLIPLLRPSGLRDKTFLAHALPALLFLTATLSIFVISSNYEWLYQRTTVNRTLLIAAPLIIFSLGIFTGGNILNNGMCVDKKEKE